MGQSGPSVRHAVAVDQLTRWQQPANWVQHLINCNWQLDIMILTPVRDHRQLMVVSSPALGTG
eukprot:225800-Prymnesium_polylepis.1